MADDGSKLGGGLAMHAETPGARMRGHPPGHAFFCCRRLIRPSTPEVRVTCSNSAR